MKILPLENPRSNGDSILSFITHRDWLPSPVEFINAIVIQGRRSIIVVLSFPCGQSMVVLAGALMEDLIRWLVSYFSHRYQWHLWVISSAFEGIIHRKYARETTGQNILLPSNSAFQLHPRMITIVVVCEPYRSSANSYAKFAPNRRPAAHASPRISSAGERSISPSIRGRYPVTGRRERRIAGIQSPKCWRPLCFP